MINIKPIKGYDFDYFVDESGNIYRKLTPNKHPQGYLRMGLRSNGVRKWFSIHRIVAENFIPNPDNKKYVNHIDGDKTNNNVKNLEWCTQSENMIHAYKNGLKEPSHPRPVRQYTLDGEFEAEYPTMTDAGKAVGTTGSNISRAIKVNKPCKGFRWEVV